MAELCALPSTLAATTPPSVQPLICLTFTFILRYHSSENCPLDIFHNTMFGIKRQLDTLFLPWALLWGSARAQRVNPNKDRGRKNKLESGSVKRSCKMGVCEHEDLVPNTS